MNANQEKEIISEKLNILHSEVYQQMMNEEKNKYDPEIKLPFNKFVHIELKTEKFRRAEISKKKWAGGLVECTLFRKIHMKGGFLMIGTSAQNLF